MRIYKTDTVEDIRNRFNNEYPFLQLEFYEKAHAHYVGSKKSEQMPHLTTLGALNPLLEDADIPTDELISVSDLEESFEDIAGLHVQVFRKSGEQWLQTTSTDDWTLRKHSEKAEELQRFKEQKI